MNLFYIYKSICLIVCIYIQSIFTLPLAVSNSISLYNQSDKLTVLNSEDFVSTVYQSKTAWLIEFYASWCGHCQSYAKIYRELGIDTWAWQSVVRIGAMNCYGGNNAPLCRQHNVRGYPTLLLVPPSAVFNQSKLLSIPATDMYSVELELIKGLEDFDIKNGSWPQFTPKNRVIMEELYANAPKSTKLRLVVVERRDDLTGRQLMLDFSKYHSEISIFRTTTDGQFWRKLPINRTDVPALFVILRNRTAQRLDLKHNATIQLNSRQFFKELILSYVQQQNLIDNFQIDIPLTTSQSISTQPNILDDTRDQFTVHKKIHMLDLELALSYMFRYEIPQADRIQGAAYTALKQWLNVLVKYFPGREQLLTHLKMIALKIDENSRGLTGNQVREIFDMEPTNVYFPSDRQQYQHCAGSSPQFRGYPCALWTLFHTLTVSQYSIESKLSNPVDVFEIPLAVKNYVKHFFGCKKCSENFMEETKNIDQLNLTNKQAAVLYFWKIHNQVNQRLRFDVTEDPKHPKVQFPSRYLCETCQSNDLSKTMDFLLEYYSKENIDQSIPQKNADSKEDIPDFLLSKDARIEFVIDGPGYFTRTLQRFSLYLLFGLIILIIFIRRRYCKTSIRHLYTAKRIL